MRFNDEENFRKMMKNKIFFFFLLIFLISVKSSSAELSCSIRSNSCNAGETCVYAMSDLSNAHAELCSSGIYTQKVCCADTGGATLGTVSGTKILGLEATTNAHVEQGTLSNYGTPAYLSATNNNVVCTYKSACDLNEVCLSSISDTTNAHIGSCAAYSLKACCRLSPFPTYSSFDGSTTNFASVADLTNTGATLEKINFGKIAWVSSSMNVEGANFNTNVAIGDKFVSVNSVNLHSTLNSAADITIKNVDCGNFIVYKASGFYTTLQDIVSNGAECSVSDCTNIQCSAGTLTFRASGFSSYGARAPPAIPEFNGFTLILALTVSMLGFLFVRNQREHFQKPKI